MHPNGFLRSLLCAACLSLTAPVLSAAPTQGSDWPRFLGPAATGMSSERGINRDWQAHPPKLLWKIPMGDHGYACPSAAGDLVYIVDHDGSRDIVRALRLADGTEVWRFPYEETNQNKYGFARATPTIESGRVYTCSRSGRVHCVDARTGALIWKHDLIADFGGEHPMWDYAASPVVDGRRLLLCAGGAKGTIVAVDKETGALLWRGGEGDVPAYCTPVIAKLAGRRQYVLGVAKGFVGVDPDKGTVLWRIPWPTLDGTNIATPIVVDDHSVFITSGYDMGCAMIDVSADGARIRWQNKDMRAHIATPLLWKGRLYGNCDPGRLVCMDPQTGSVVWSQPGFEKGSLMAIDGTIIALNGSNGDVIQIELTPEKYHELGRITPIPGQNWTPPIVSHGRLIVRTKEALACLDLR